MGCAGIDPQALQAAAQYSAAHRGVALVVMQSGKVVFEDYPHGSRGNSTKIYSGTKGFWNFAALAAQEDGIIDLDDKAASTLTEWSADPKKSRLTIRELLNFSAGLNEAYSLHGDGWDDRNAFALKQPVLGSPGGTFIYGPTGLQCFHEILKRKLAAKGETPTHFLERRVLKPLGLGSQRYLTDRSGNPLLAAGFTMSATQWAKLGRALVSGGSPVLHGGSVNEALRGSGANPMFGLGFWNNRMASTPGVREVDPESMLERKWHQQRWHNACICRSAPSDLVAAVGSGGQRLYVIPSMNLIVVRQGQLTKFSDGAFLKTLLSKGSSS